MTRTMPACEEAEQHVLACCLLENSDTLARATSHGLTPDSFYWPANTIIFHRLQGMAERQLPITMEVLSSELGDGDLNKIGGWPYLMQVTGNIPTTAHAEYFIEQVAALAQKRTLIRAATDLLEHAYNGSTVPELSELAQRLQPAPRTVGPKPAPITSFGYPSDNDPNMLLGSEDYLGRGGGLLFVSHAGAGKSSWAMDACMMWALGKPWMGIAAHAPRKILIVQAEDSDRYIGKIFTSFAHVNQLTPQDTATLTTNVIIIRLKGVSGPAFFAALTQLTALHKPDLVVINPIYLYAEGDITRSEFAQPFLIGLDRVNREEKFAYILIHHTGKPTAKGTNGRRAVVEDWESAYMGFGSSYLANWPRATILLEPVPESPGHYQIKLGKGGLNAGITRAVTSGTTTRQEPCTRISIRHSRDRMEVNGKERPVYYWDLDDSEPAAEKPKGGRPPKYQIEPHLRFIPVTRQAADTAPKLHRAMNGASGIPLSSWSDLLLRAATEGLIILTDIPGKGPCYYRATETQSNNTSY